MRPKRRTKEPVRDDIKRQRLLSSDDDDDDDRMSEVNSDPDYDHEMDLHTQNIMQVDDDMGLDTDYDHEQRKLIKFG